MTESYFHKSNLNFRDKFFSLDFKLIILVLLLGIISFFAIYSTERGNFEYYTVSHIYRFFIFFFIFLAISFINIGFWHKSAYLFYVIVILLLFSVDFFGVVASGSKRWINLFVFNLQPSELTKVALIVFLARYYNKIPTHDVNHIKTMILPTFALFIPITLVINQPDLGTAMLIAGGGLSIIWLAGFKMKYFLFSSIVLIRLKAFSDRCNFWGTKRYAYAWRTPLPTRPRI